MAENGHYWQVEGENASAQIIDNVLSDLSDALVEGPPIGEEEKIAVIRVPADPDAEPGTKESRDHFELGETGEDVPPVSAGLNEIIVGDGNNWIKRSVTSFYNNYLYEKDQTTGMPVGQGIISYNPNFPTTFGQVIHQQDSPYPYLVNGFTSRDTAKATIQGTSQIVIGDADTTYSGTSFWNKAMTGPEITIGGCAKIEMFGSENNVIGAGIPTISMRGHALFDMSEKVSGSYANFSRGSHFGSIGRQSPFVTSAFPILKVADEATVTIFERATLNMQNGATFNMIGNSEVHIAGGDCTTGYHNQERRYMGATTIVGIEPYSKIKVRGSADGDGTLYIQPKQLAIGTCFGVNSDMSGLGDFGYNHNKAQSDFGGSSDSFPYKFSKIYGKGANVKHTSGMCGPGLLMQGNSQVVIGDSGNISISLKTYDNFVIDADQKGDVKIDLKNGANSNTHFLFADGGNCQNHLGYQPAVYANTTMLLEPRGYTSIDFKPTAVCGINFQPRLTDIEAKWMSLQMIAEGVDNYIQMDGNTHLESWSGTVILRNTNPYLQDRITNTNNIPLPHFPLLNNVASEKVKNGARVIDTRSSLTRDQFVNDHLDDCIAAVHKKLNGNVWNTYTDENSYGYDALWSSDVPSKIKIAKNKINILNVTSDAKIENYVSSLYYDSADAFLSAEGIQSQISTLGVTGTLSTTSTTQLIREKNYWGSGYKYKVLGLKITDTSPSDLSYEAKSEEDLPFPVYTATTYTKCSSAQQSVLNSLYTRPVNKYVSFSGGGNFEKTFKDYDVIAWVNTGDDMKAEALELNAVLKLNITLYFKNDMTGKTVADIIQTNEYKSFIKSMFGNGATIDTSSASVNNSYDSYSYIYNSRISNITVTYNTKLINYIVNSVSKLSPDANKSYNSLTSYTQNLIREQFTYQRDNSNSFAPQCDVYVQTTTTTGAYTNNYYCYKGNVYGMFTVNRDHLEKTWGAPIQTAQRQTDNGFDKAPIIQAYGPVNFLMREKVYGTDINGWTFEANENEFDVTNQKTALHQFVNSNYYQDLLDYIAEGDASKELWYLRTISTNDNIHYTVSYARKLITWHDHIDSYPDNPVFEMTDDSEFRLYGGAKITAETKYGETTVTFSGDVDEESVSFTLAELKALKNLLTNPPL